MSTPSDMMLYRFLKRLKLVKQEITTAQVRIGDINKQLQENINNQKILNKHLAEQNAAWRKLNEAKPKVGLYVVS